MIGGLSGLAAVVAGIACLVLLPIPLLVIAGVVMSASGTTLVVLAVFWWLVARSVWRWLTKPCVEPNTDVIHTPRGTKPEPETPSESPHRKDEVKAGARSSLDDPEDDGAGWDLG